MIDVHVITMPGREAWQKECFDTLTDSNIVIHKVPFHPNVDAARLDGLSKGTAKYVSWVDDDDWSVPGYFLEAEGYLESHPEVLAVYCSEMRIKDNRGHKMEFAVYPPLNEPWDPKKQISHRPYVHHGAVMRREEVEKHLHHYCKEEWRLLDYFLFTRIALTGPVVHLPRIGYKWRIHQEGHHRRPDIYQSVNMVYDKFVEEFPFLKSE